MKKKQKHTVKRAEIGGHSDQFECSCGWKSNAYWDLEEAAWGEWLLHAYDTKTAIRSVFQEHQARLVKDRDQQLQRLRAQRAHIDKQIAILEPKRKRS